MIYIGISLLTLVVLVNLFIILTGRFYLYKGIANTYLAGKTGPGIYDLNVFQNRMIKASQKTAPWEQDDSFNNVKLSKKERKLMSANGTTAFLVFKDKKIVFEKYREEHDISTVSNSFSAAKTVVSMLVGIAIEEGLIKSIDEPVGNYLEPFTSEEKNTLQSSICFICPLD